MRARILFSTSNRSFMPLLLPRDLHCLQSNVDWFVQVGWADGMDGQMLESTAAKQQVPPLRILE